MRILCALILLPLLLSGCSSDCPPACEQVTTETIVGGTVVRETCDSPCATRIHSDANIRRVQEQLDLETLRSQERLKLAEIHLREQELLLDYNNAIDPCTYGD